MYVFVLVKCSIATEPEETTVIIEVIDFVAFPLNSRREICIYGRYFPFL